MGTLEDRSGLAAVSAALLAMNRQLEVREVLQTIVASARELRGAEYAALGVPDDHGGFAQFVVDGVSEEQWKAIGPLPRQHGILAAMLHDATPQRLADVREHPRFEGWPSAHPDMADFLGMPIADDGEVLGALFLANKRRRPSDPAELPGRTERRDCPGPDWPAPTESAPTESASSERQSGAGQEPTTGGRVPGEEDTTGEDGCGFTGEDEQLLRLLAQHAAIALTNARLYERSREFTIARERARISHELHDAVAQKLFSLRLTAQAVTALVDRDPGRAKSELNEIARLSAEAADELRAAVTELRPAELDEDGLVPTLRNQARVLDRAHSARVSFVSAGVRALPAAQEEALLRVTQEAVHNALRHAGAGGVEISLVRKDPGARLRVTDDGCGFDPRAVRRAGRHLGLASMRDRAAGVGGTLTVQSEPGKGTVIDMEVPGG